MPKAGVDWKSSLHPSNPYNFPPDLLEASKIPPVVTDTHVLFFGYEGDDPHVCFQQWYPSPFKADDAEFVTTEHYMMYHKSMLMGDKETAEKILAAPHPSEAKLLGRQVKNFDQDIWNAHADQIVEMGNYLKFTQHQDLKEVLMKTGEKEIVETR